MKTTTGRTTLLLAVMATLAALPAVGQLSAPCLTGPFYIGDCPGWVDMNGNGKWDQGVDKLITFSFSVGAGILTVQNPWSMQCDDDTGNQITFGSPTGCGFNSASRNHPIIGMQTIMATGFTGGGLPNAFSLTQQNSSIGGTGNMMPDTGPPYSGIQLGGGISMLVGPFQGVDASGGGGTFNHVTIPWAQASALGMNGPCKIASIDPQIFLPVVPGTDPGTFQLVPKFGGNSVGMCSSPELVLAAFQPFANIPTLGEWGLIALLLGLGMTGWGLLRRSGVLA